ncbi:MAG TPA: ferredoxin-type protein NapF [Azospirillaceae bacterium]|nr:ferredoxin-type protein NapF [Azospirillaceae bacterium]
MRPPWARADRFTDLCTRCGACARACGAGLLRPGDGGFPVADLARGECSFCGACAEACPEPLFLPRDLAPWRLEVAVAPACFAAGGTYCRSCGDACPEGALRFEVGLGGRAAVRVDAEACTGCGACAAACPAGAVSLHPAREEAGRAA